MKVKIRTLKQEKYEVEIEASETVSKLKDIVEERYQFPKAWQILIFSGKILANEKTIESYKIEEKDFLVLMVKKPTGEEATPQPAAEKQPEKNEEKKEEPKEQPAAHVPTPSAVPASSSASAAPPTQPAPAASASAAAAQQQEYNASVERICELGFPRDQVEAALRAAFNNADRAVEYLFNGIPDTAMAAVQPAAQVQPAQPAQPAAQPAQARAPPSPQRAAVAGGSGVFDALRNHPQFPALCNLAQTGGEDALKQILTYFAQTNPQLIQVIAQHQDEFIQLLNTPLPNAGAGAGGLGGVGGGLGGAGPTPGVIRVQVTPEDEQIINTLVGMGFDKNKVMEAYFLFEKDYTMTANYLLNNGQEEDFDMGGDDGGGAYGDEGEGEGDDDDDGDYQ